MLYILLCLYGVFLLAYGIIVIKSETIFAWFWPFFAAVIFYLVLRIFLDTELDSESGSRLFVAAEIGLLLLYFVVLWFAGKSNFKLCKLAKKDCF